MNVVIRDVSETTAYSKLCDWIEEARLEARDTNGERFSLRRTSNTLVHKELKKGRLVPRQKDHPDLPQPQPDPATAHLDQNITQRVLDA